MQQQLASAASLPHEQPHDACVCALANGPAFKTSCRAPRHAPRGPLIVSGRGMLSSRSWGMSDSVGAGCVELKATQLGQVRGRNPPQQPTGEGMNNRVEELVKDGQR
jgi:hypothetical protein